MAAPAKLCGDCGTQMEVNADLFALPGLDYTPSGVQFNTSRALPVTAYICPKCGRFKFLSAIFLNNLAGQKATEDGSGSELPAGS